VLDLGEVWVAAPRQQQSGLSRSHPAGRVSVTEGMMEMDHTQVPTFAFDASPASAVRHGILRFLPRTPDLAISGINYGENIGAATTVSGTVGAAIEAACFGVPTLAASLETDRKYHFSQSSEVDFRAAASFVRRFARWVLDHGMPKGVDILRLDVPAEATPDTPWRVTRVSRQQYFISPVILDAQGKKHLRPYVTEFDAHTLEPDSDVRAFAIDRMVAVSPLTIDLTAKVNLRSLQQRIARGLPGQ
jgi:5'-nucleotidase